ncbi:hypothetical protein GGQ54_000835 [Naumannella cuiyingiana]|uniref:DUF559 domain-containing protein n=1 Tax=Naumannella cuiyingiana TaxID=1347891 RepID=A0A7Z0D7H7_9ACTN|nr:hypothetical protein [Naumannella cuiyingiana]NYI70275.1 hypothetical protein [Naumannella cuiyingiana]
MGHGELAALNRPFTVAEAAAHGVSRTMLDSARYAGVLPGVHVAVGTTVEATGLAAAIRGLLRSPVLFDGLTALQLRGLDLGRPLPVRLAVPPARVIRRRGIVARRVVRLPEADGDVAVVADAFARVGADHSATDTVIIGDRLLHLGLATPEELAGVPLVRAGAESPRETLLRLALVLAGLPEPQCNVWIRDGATRVARVDLYYPRWRVAIEYEGDHHRTERRQWNRDIERYAELGRLGVHTVRVTASHLSRANNVAVDVYRAIAERGYDGPPPLLGDAWAATFARPSGAALSEVPVTEL